MADPAQIEQLLQRTRDFIARKQADEMAIFAAPLRAGMVTTITNLQETLKTLDENDDLYAPTLKELQATQLGLSAFDAGQDSVRERYDASKIDTADIYQLLGDVAQEIQANLGIDWKSPDFISLWDSVDNHIVNNLFVPIDTRQFTFGVRDQAGVVLDDAALGLSPEIMNNLRLAIETAMVDSENEAIKWPAAMTKDRKIGIIVAQLKESDLITGIQRNYDKNLYDNIEANWPRITYDIDQYTSASTRNFADGVDKVLDKALEPTRSDEQGRLSGWLQLGTENFIGFDEYESQYKTEGMAIEDIAKWGSAAALKELEDYIKLQFPDALITDAQKDARDRIIAEGKIALQGNIDSLGAKTPIEHIAAVNENIFRHYVYGGQGRLGVEDQLEQAKALEDSEQYIEDRGKAFEKFDTEAEAYSAVDKFINLWGWGAEIPDSIRDDIAKDVYDTYQRASFDPSAPIPTLNDILAPYVSNVPNWINFKRNQDVLQSETELPQAIRDMLGMGESMLKRTPEVWQALDTGARISLEELIRNAYELDPYSSKSPSDYAAEFMQSRGITPSGDIGEYPTVWSPTVGDINYPTGETFIPQRPTLTPEEMAAGYTYGDVPATDAELDAEYIRRLEEAGLPRAIIDFETRRITDEYQKAMVEEQLQSGRPPQIPEEFINFARDYQGYDFMGDIGVQATNARTKATKARAALEGITDASERVREEFQVRELETIADKFEGLVAQQVGDPTFARLTDADFPTREGLLGGIRDEFSGSAAGREFIERQISEGNIDFSDIDTRLGEINRAEGLRHPQTMPADPMALVPSFTQQQLPALTQKFAQEQQEEQIRRGELTGMGSTIFRRRTL